MKLFLNITIHDFGPGPGRKWPRPRSGAGAIFILRGRGLVGPGSVRGRGGRPRPGAPVIPWCRCRYQNFRCRCRHPKKKLVSDVGSVSVSVGPHPQSWCRLSGQCRPPTSKDRCRRSLLVTMEFGTQETVRKKFVWYRSWSKFYRFYTHKHNSRKITETETSSLAVSVDPCRPTGRSAKKFPSGPKTYRPGVRHASLVLILPTQTKKTLSYQQGTTTPVVGADTDTDPDTDTSYEYRHRYRHQIFFGCRHRHPTPEILVPTPTPTPAMSTDTDTDTRNFFHFFPLILH